MTNRMIRNTDWDAMESHKFSPHGMQLMELNFFLLCSVAHPNSILKGILWGAENKESYLEWRMEIGAKSFIAKFLLVRDVHQRIALHLFVLHLFALTPLTGIHHVLIYVLSFLV